MYSTTDSYFKNINSTLYKILYCVLILHLAMEKLHLYTFSYERKKIPYFKSWPDLILRFRYSDYWGFGLMVLRTKGDLYQWGFGI